MLHFMRFTCTANSFLPSLLIRARRGRGTLRKLLEIDGKGSLFVGEYGGKVLVGVEAGPQGDSGSQAEAKIITQGEKREPSPPALKFGVPDTMESLYASTGNGAVDFVEDLLAIFGALETILFQT